MSSLSIIGNTSLRFLHIKSSYIVIESVAKRLSFPSALTHLWLQHHKYTRSSFHSKEDVPEEFVQETQTKEDLCRAIMQQRHSLETLNVTGWGISPPPNEQVQLIPRYVKTRASLGDGSLGQYRWLKGLVCSMDLNHFLHLLERTTVFIAEM